MKRSGMVVILGMGLVGAGTVHGVSLNERLRLSPDIKKKLEMVKSLVTAGGPFLEAQFKNDPAKLKLVQQLLAAVSFVPALVVTMDDLQTTIPSVPREIAETIIQMRKSVAEADQDFKKATLAATIDEKTEEVLKGLKNLQTGLEGPGNYLVSLNAKTFKQVLELFEALPGLDEKMVIKRRNKTTGQVEPAPISDILTELFGILKNITDKYTNGFKAMDLVINKLLQENKALKNEVSALRSSGGNVADVPSVASTPTAQDQHILDDVFEF